MNNIICICGNAVDKEIQFCDTCGLGLPEIKLKEPKIKIDPIDILSKVVMKEYSKNLDNYFIKLSESF